MQALLDRFRSMAGLSLGALLPVEPRTLLAACAERLGPEAPRLEFSGEAESVLGDRGMLEEAFLNLIRNAKEAGAGRHDPIRVEVGAAIRDRRLLLSFRDDNGPVDPAIFERLGRERFSTKREGTGLGLLFVGRVAALHGGSFAIGPTAEGGFEAVLGLPLARKDEPN
jgi:signal transduction histidine kinase